MLGTERTERKELTLSKKVMVVDDSRVLHAQMSKILQETDYEIVQFCKDGETALETYGDFRPDVITVDIIMPGIDGLETTRELLEKWPDARVLVTSSLVYDETIDEAQKLGAKGFISKPLKREEVIAALDSALES